MLLFLFFYLKNFHFLYLFTNLFTDMDFFVKILEALVSWGVNKWKWVVFFYKNFVLYPPNN